MKKFVTVFLILGFSNIALSNDRGVVVLDHYECKSHDHIVIETSMGYTLAEVYEGYENTYEGHVVYGNLHAYFFNEIYDEDGNQIGSLYLEDYMVDESRALKWCYEE
tara:strand:- start:21 stop:341 length:321 start_codon:yes stop_codon:yes gene_type:complete